MSHAINIRAPDRDLAVVVSVCLTLRSLSAGSIKSSNYGNIFDAFGNDRIVPRPQRDHIGIVLTDLPSWADTEYTLSDCEIVKDPRAYRLIGEMSRKQEVSPLHPIAFYEAVQILRITWVHFVNT